MQALVSGELVLDSQLATRLSGLLNQPAATAPDLAGLTRGLEITTLAVPGPGNAEIGRALFRAKKAVRDNVTALLAKISLATPSACPARGAITSTQAWFHPGRAGIAIRNGQAAGRGKTSCFGCWPPGTPTARSPASWASPREPCAATWKTSTNG